MRRTWRAVREAAGVQMITVHGRTRCQFYKGDADWQAVRAVRDATSLPLVVNGDITSFTRAVDALKQSGADAVMIGRGAQGQPWLPGQIGRRLQSGIAELAPKLGVQLSYISRLYDELLTHYGLRVGLRHARKHLGWALDVAAQTSAVPIDALKHWRGVILTAEEPAVVQQSLQAAFDDFAWRVRRMSGLAAESRPQRPPDSDAILNALPNPVMLIAPDGKIVDANIAAEAFFETSIQLLQRQSLKELVPFGSPLLALIDQVRQRNSPVNEYKVDLGTPRMGGDRQVDLHVAPLNGAARPCRGDAAGAQHRRQDGSAASPIAAPRAR